MIVRPIHPTNRYNIKLDRLWCGLVRGGGWMKRAIIQVLQCMLDFLNNVIYMNTSFCVV